MRIEIRNDKVVLDGYVNAVGRDSRPIITKYGRVVEQIEPGAFSRALGRNDSIDIMLNHEKRITSTKEGTAQLYEDNIGLRAIVETSDAEVVEKAREGELRGWSFGMTNVVDEIETRAEGKLPRRIVKDLDLLEVTIVDNRRTPAYTGTLIEQRAEEEIITETRTTEYQAITEDLSKKQTVDFSIYEEKINLLKKEN